MRVTLETLQTGGFSDFKGYLLWETKPSLEVHECPCTPNHRDHMRGPSVDASLSHDPGTRDAVQAKVLYILDYIGTKTGAKRSPNT